VILLFFPAFSSGRLALKEPLYFFVVSLNLLAAGGSCDRNAGGNALAVLAGRVGGYLLQSS
jgi:hypothetical protein